MPSDEGYRKLARESVFSEVELRAELSHLGNSEAVVVTNLALSSGLSLRQAKGVWADQEVDGVPNRYRTGYGYD